MALVLSLFLLSAPPLSAPLLSLPPFSLRPLIPGHLKRLTPTQRHLKPGGYLEFQEFHIAVRCDDGSLPANEPYRFADLLTHMGAGLAALGSDINAVLSVPEHLTAAGFSPTAHHVLKCPVGSWPKLPRLAYCGDLLRTALLEGLAGYARVPLIRGLGWTGVQVEMLLVEVRRALEEKSGVHVYFPFHVLYGQKPHLS